MGKKKKRSQGRGRGKREGKGRYNHFSNKKGGKKKEKQTTTDSLLPLSLSFYAGGKGTERRKGSGKGGEKKEEEGVLFPPLRTSGETERKKEVEEIGREKKKRGEGEKSKNLPSPAIQKAKEEGHPGGTRGGEGKRKKVLNTPLYSRKGGGGPKKTK